MFRNFKHANVFPGLLELKGSTTEGGSYIVIWKRVSFLFIFESLVLVISSKEISRSWPSGFGETLLKNTPFGVIFQIFYMFSLWKLEMISGLSASCKKRSRNFLKCLNDSHKVSLHSWSIWELLHGVISIVPKIKVQARNLILHFAQLVCPICI